MASGHSQEEFLAAYEGNTAARNEEALQASPVAAMVVEFMELQTEWEGTPTALLAELEVLAQERRVNTKAKRWPQVAQALSRRLNEVRPNLAAVGISVRMRRDASRRAVVIKKVSPNCRGGATSDRSTDDTLSPPEALHDAARGLSLAAPSSDPLLLDASGTCADADDADDASRGLL